MLSNELKNPHIINKASKGAERCSSGFKALQHCEYFTVTCLPMYFSHPLQNGDLAIGFFNMGETDTNMTVSVYDLGFDSGCGKTLSLFDVWSKETSRPVNGSITHAVKAHECVVYRASVVDA